MMLDALVRGDVVSCFFFSSRRRHTRCSRDWSSDVCSSDLDGAGKGDGVAITLVVGADAGNQSLSNRIQKGGRQVGRFADELLKRAGGNLEEQAFLVGDHVGGPRTVVKQSDFAEEFTGSHRHQDAFLACNHHAHAHLPLEHEIHRIARTALLDDFRPLLHRVQLHEIYEPLQLPVAESSEDPDAPQRAGFERHRCAVGRADRGRRRARRRSRLKKHFQLRDAAGLQPVILLLEVNPGVRRDSLFLHPVDQRGQIDGPIHHIVHAPNAIARGVVVGLHEPLFSRRANGNKGEKMRSAARGANPFLIAAVDSCGAATRRWPTASAVGWGYCKLEPRSGERKSSWTPSLSPLTGAFRKSHGSPRLTPWATIFRHCVADSSLAGCPNSDLRPPRRYICSVVPTPRTSRPWFNTRAVKSHNAKRVARSGSAAFNTGQFS